MSASRRERIVSILGFVALVSTFGAVAYSVGYVVFQTDTFDLRQIDVEGCVELEDWEIRSTLHPWLGSHVMLEVDVDSMAQDVLALGWVRRVRIEKDLPDRVRVFVEEWRPALTVKQGWGLWYSDPAGHLFAGQSADHFKDLPTLTVPEDLESGILALVVPESLALIERVNRAADEEAVSGVHYDALLGYSIELQAVEYYVGWDLDGVHDEMIANARSWLPAGHRIPAAVIGIPGSSDLIVRLHGVQPGDAQVSVADDKELRSGVVRSPRSRL
jgi:hypothetical protein